MSKELPARQVYEMIRGQGWQTNWTRRIRKFGARLHITPTTKGEWANSDGNIIRLVQEWEAHRWREGLADKSTLSIYRQKKAICREQIYDNSYPSALLFRARAGSLETNKRLAKFRPLTETCDLCGEGVEDVVHVLCGCEALAEYRMGREETTVEEWLGLAGEGTEKEVVITATKRLLGGWWALKQQIGMRGNDGGRRSSHD